MGWVLFILDGLALIIAWLWPVLFLAGLRSFLEYQKPK
jgi:hypothetical protein